MEDFKWCVWLSPPDGHAWHGFIEGVPAHLSVAVYLETEKEADKMASSLVGRRAIVRWSSPLVETCTNGFYALTRAVEIAASGSSVCEWWPDDAHISFGYKYGAPFTRRETDSVAQRLSLRHHEAELSVCRVVKASGHYRDWTRRTLHK